MIFAEAEKRRYERRRQERERFEATADRLSGELRSLPSGVEKTAYHEAKGIEPLPEVPVRNGDLLVPGYDVEGKVWTLQYIKEDGTKGTTQIRVILYAKEPSFRTSAFAISQR